MRIRHKTRVTFFKQTKNLLVLVLIGVSLAGIVLNLNNVQNLYSRATAEKANLVIDTNKVIGQLNKPWRNLAQGGEDHAWRLAPLSNQIATLHPEYIRIDHVFDFYDIVSGSSGNLQFNYSKLDLVLDDIAGVGAKPYISLSYMPINISTGSIVDPPINFVDWQVAVQNLVQHVSGTKGLRDVYYEVWNEPDLFGGWKYFGNDRNYLNLYTAAAQGARNARNVQPFKLGGPATTALYTNWLDALAEHVITNNLQLDFISWHRYTTDLSQFRTDMITAQNWVHKYPQLEPTLEFHITEWGHDSELSSGYDSNYAAAHTAAAAIEMNAVIEKAFVFEIQDGKSPEGKSHWGRWGMFTHQDFGAQPKPRFRALQLLERLGDERVQLFGKGTYVKALASKSASNTFQVALANFDTWGLNTEAVPVTFTALEPGNYQITHWFLTKQPRTFHEPVDELGELKTVVQMGKHEVAVVEIKKQ